MQRHRLGRFLSTTGTPKGEPARRALSDFRKNKRAWLRHGIAALAISGLGIGVAGAVAVTGTAQQAGSDPGVSVATGAPNAPVAGAQGGAGTSRNQDRPPLPEASGSPSVDKAEQKARQQAQQNAGHTDTQVRDDDLAQAAQQRAKALKAAAKDTENLSEEMSREERKEHLQQVRERIQERYERKRAQQEQQQGQDQQTQQAAPVASDDSGSDDSGATSTGDSGGAAQAASSGGGGGSSLPIASGSYSIAAGFGQVGSWSRYHTGVDFSAAMGTPILAAGQGTVTNAGIGSASGWAGNYVTIEFADGQQMLYAHMSTVSVSVGQTVSGGQVIGNVGMTGRSFGPHVHVELYPSGVAPGDVYSAVDPMGWFNSNGAG